MLYINRRSGIKCCILIGEVVSSAVYYKEKWYQVKKVKTSESPSGIKVIEKINGGGRGEG